MHIQGLFQNLQQHGLFQNQLSLQMFLALDHDLFQDHGAHVLFQSREALWVMFINPPQDRSYLPAGS